MTNEAVLGLIPARGGSKSIPRKNIVPLNGRPMIEYSARAGQKSKLIEQVLCSTDAPDIMDVCARLGVEVLPRPERLARDETHVIDVILDVLEVLDRERDLRPEYVALLQPTSPFVTPEQIDQAARLLLERPEAGSVQTISRPPHNFHAYNQRTFENGEVRFRFPEERAVCYNKQTKPVFYTFGNLVITRTRALREQHNVFALPSLGLEIPAPYALDVDGPDDLITAEWFMERKLVRLEHLPL